MFDIKEIRPFNDVFFYNCTHSCLFSILSANNGDYREFMVNSILYFSVRKDKNVNWFLTRIDFKKNHEKMIKEQGFIIEKKDYDNTIVDYIYNKIKKNCPVIVSVDCYELDYRDDLYQVDCWPHSILIYDYDEVKKVFNVIDQSNRDDMFFGCYEISYVQLEKAIRLYWRNSINIETYNSDIAVAFYCSNSYKKRNNNELFNDWIVNRSNNDLLLMNGILDVESIIPDLIATLANIEKKDKCSEENMCGDLLTGLNDVVKQKKWEQSFIMGISEGNEKYMIIKKIYDEWVNVRKHAGLIILSGKARKKSLSLFEENLKNVLEHERKLQSIVRNEVGD